MLTTPINTNNNKDMKSIYWLEIDKTGGGVKPVNVI